MSGVFGERALLGQANGPDVELVVSGSELYATYETVDGFPAIYDDALGLFCLRARGRRHAIESTARAGHRAAAGRLSLHAREADAVRAEKIRGARRAWSGERPIQRERSDRMSAIFGEILTFGQPNGPDVALRVFGDEHYARYENLERLHGRLRRRARTVLLRAAGGRRVPLDRRARWTRRRRPDWRATCRNRRRSSRPRPTRGGRRRAAVAGAARRRGRGAHVRPEPGAARRARPVDRRGQGADHPRQLPGRRPAPSRAPTSTRC